MAVNDDDVRANNARLAQQAAEREAQRYRMQLRHLVDVIGANPRALAVLASLMAHWRIDGARLCASVADVWAMGSGALVFRDEKTLEGSMKAATQMARDFRMMEIERYDCVAELRAAAQSLGIEVEIA